MRTERSCWISPSVCFFFWAFLIERIGRIGGLRYQLLLQFRSLSENLVLGFRCDVMALGNVLTQPRVVLIQNARLLSRYIGILSSSFSIFLEIGSTVLCSYRLSGVDLVAKDLPDVRSQYKLSTFLYGQTVAICNNVWAYGPIYWWFINSRIDRLQKAFARIPHTSLRILAGVMKQLTVSHESSLTMLESWINKLSTLSFSITRRLGNWIKIFWETKGSELPTRL